jgi:hypothetical protein
MKISEAEQKRRSLVAKLIDRKILPERPPHHVVFAYARRGPLSYSRLPRDEGLPLLNDAKIEPLPSLAELIDEEVR